ncbi:hypothetical protein LQV05_006593 [Cryptococcus neoformans]|nr:hypothetical protein LQV05_006593 [Cryptococcus neoformans]
MPTRKQPTTKKRPQVAPPRQDLFDVDFESEEENHSQASVRQIQKATPVTYSKRSLQSADNVRQPETGETIVYGEGENSSEDEEFEDSEEKSSSDTEDQDREVDASLIETRRQKAINKNNKHFAQKHGYATINSPSLPSPGEHIDGFNLTITNQRAAERGASSQQPSRTPSQRFSRVQSTGRSNVGSGQLTTSATHSRNGIPINIIYYLISGDEEREGDGEISTDIWSQDIILETSDEILDDLSASMGVGTMKLLYYNDALNQAVQVLGPLREFFETILTSFGPDNKVDGIVPALKKARDCTVYGAAADYIHFCAMDAKHMDLSKIRQSFPKIVSSSKLRSKDDSTLYLHFNDYDKEIHGGWKSTMAAGLNVPLNEHDSFLTDPNGYMSSRMDSGGGPSTPLEMADLPGPLPTFLFDWEATDDGENIEPFLRASLSLEFATEIPQPNDYVHFLLCPAASIDHIDKAVHKSLYHFAIIFFQSLEDDEQKSILEFYAQRATVEEDQKDQVVMWKSIRQWQDKRRLSKRPRL